MQSIVVNFSIVRSNRNLGSSSAYGRLNWMTWPMRLSAEQKHRPGRNLPGHGKPKAPVLTTLTGASAAGCDVLASLESVPPRHGDGSVRRGLSAGGRRIRTLGPPLDLRWALSVKTSPMFFGCERDMRRFSGG